MTTTTVTDPQAAARAAADAHAAVSKAEQAIASGKQFSADKLIALVTGARHADLEAQATRDRAELERSDARREALAGVAGQIDAIAAAGPEGLAQALADVVGAAGRAREAAQKWDEQLTSIIDAGSALGCRPAAPGGPREADEHVAVDSQKKTAHHGEQLLQLARPTIESALSHALRGDLVSAEAAVVVTRHVAALKRADLYVQGRGGMILPIHGDLSVQQRAQVNTGQLTVLSERQVRQYLAGEQVTSE